MNTANSNKKSRLIFCFDGTWNRLDSQNPTNVVLTAESILPIDKNGVPQIIFYSQGVGSNKYDHLIGGVFGAGLFKNISDAYRHLIFNYTPGDEIFIFGFSRGAYTARSFVGLLRHIGIVSRSKANSVEDAIKSYQNRIPNSDCDSPESNKTRLEFSPEICVSKEEYEWRTQNTKEYNLDESHILTIKYVGVWDTVGALGVPKRYSFANKFNKKFSFHDIHLTPMVLSARHALAIDETREDFEPSLWQGLDELNRKRGKNPDDNDAPYLQKWFPGVHCAVGGGGDDRGLSDETLEWIWDGARQNGLEFDTSPSSKIYSLRPNCMAPLFPFKEPKTKIQQLKEKISDVLWSRKSRKGPERISDIALFARRRWCAKPQDFPSKKAYRPQTLSNIASEIDKNINSDVSLNIPEEFDIYIVKPGDVLSRISEKKYGTVKKVDEILEMNHDKIDDANHIYAGMSLKLPKI